MAAIGVRYAVFAPIESEGPDGQPIAYGEGCVVGRVVSANLDFERADTKLYADDVVAESANDIVGGTIALTVDHLVEEVRLKMLGDVKLDDNTMRVYSEASPYGGFGVLRVLKYRGQYIYKAYWLYKTQYAVTSVTMETKGETINFQPATVNGSLMPVIIDETMKPTVHDYKEFTDAAEAYSWLNSKANITNNEAANATTGTEGAQ